MEEIERKLVQRRLLSLDSYDKCSYIFICIFSGRTLSLKLVVDRNSLENGTNYLLNHPLCLFQRQCEPTFIFPSCGRCPPSVVRIAIAPEKG